MAGIIKPRAKIVELLSGFQGNGAEIGVQEGVFSQRLLSETKAAKIYLIDAWRHFQGYEDKANASDSHHAMKLFITTQNTNEWAPRRCIINDLSVEAASIFPDEFFEWIYIDANHAEEEVMKDLEAWYPKLKFGGMFCGDDFADGFCEDGRFGVKSAVTKFARRNNVENPNVLDTEGEMSQWWFKK